MQTMPKKISSGPSSGQTTTRQQVPLLYKSFFEIFSFLLHLLRRRNSMTYLSNFTFSAQQCRYRQNFSNEGRSVSCRSEIQNYLFSSCIQLHPPHDRFIQSYNLTIIATERSLKNGRRWRVLMLQKDDVVDNSQPTEVRQKSVLSNESAKPRIKAKE